MLVVDRHGTPLGFHLASARCAEVRLAEPTLSTVRVPRRRGRREAYAERFKVERTFAWLGNYRRLLIRWERLLIVYQGFFAFAVMLLCTNRLVQQSP